MKLRLVLISIIYLALILPTCAQSNTMYYQPLVPQAYLLNPATQPRCNVFVGLPISLYLENVNSSLHLSDLIWNDPETGQVLHPFHPDANLDDFLNQFDNENKLGLDLDYPPISFGFRVQQMYFTFDITSKTSMGFSYPNSFMELSLIGPEENGTYDFSELGFNFSERLEIGLGISRQFGEMLTVGIRPKLLVGIANISSTDNEISLFTNHEIWQVNSDISIQACVPGLIIPTDAEGDYDPEGELRFDSTLSGFADYKELALSNKGFSIDLGAHFKPLDRLTLSASVIDLGFINWKNYTHTFSINGTTEFEGIEITVDDVSDTTDFARNLIDSIKGDFDVSFSESSFKTNLEPKIFIGGNYALTRRIDAGLLARFDLLESGMKARVILHGCWHPSSFYALTISYCPIGEQATTFGTGVSGRIGPISYYTIFDYRVLKYRLYKYENIPVFLTPANRSRYNFRFGMNIVIGANHKKKLKRDKPMYYTGEY